MFSKIKVKKAALDYFRKKARESYPLEIQAYLVGNVLSIDEIEIADFKYTKQYAMQTHGGVCWYAEDVNRLKSQAETRGTQLIGDIHSHPDYDAVMSDTDYNSTITQAFSICGICSVWNNKTRVRFWTPTCSLPCDITYI
jgi:proteasome lid subunit RPN8/RPN11